MQLYDILISKQMVKQIAIPDFWARSILLKVYLTNKKGKKN